MASTGDADGETGSPADTEAEAAKEKEKAEARLPQPGSFRRWMHATLLMAVAENVLMLIVTYISNKENYRMFTFCAMLCWTTGNYCFVPE